MIKSGIDQDALINMFSAATAKQGEALRKAVAEATLKALQGRELTMENIKKVIKTVTSATTTGAALNVSSPVDVEAMLTKAFAGMDGALLQAVEANRKALQQFVDQGAALKEKQKIATSMTTQMCFNPTALSSWLTRVREAGVTLPVHLGVPGVAELTKLMTISARIGVADSARYLKKNKAMVGHLMRGGSFGPDAFLEALAATLVDRDAHVQALHVFTFNQVANTADWQRRMLNGELTA